MYKTVRTCAKSSTNYQIGYGLEVPATTVCYIANRRMKIYQTRDIYIHTLLVNIHTEPYLYILTHAESYLYYTIQSYTYTYIQSYTYTYIHI